MVAAGENEKKKRRRYLETSATDMSILSLHKFSRLRGASLNVIKV